MRGIRFLIHPDHCSKSIRLSEGRRGPDDYRFSEWGRSKSGMMQARRCRKSRDIREVRNLAKPDGNGEGSPPLT